MRRPGGEKLASRYQTKGRVCALPFQMRFG